MRSTLSRSVPAVVFKAKCLALLDEVAESRQSLVVTKRGRPVARIVPIARATAPSLKGTLLSQKDLVSPVDDVWEAEEE